jgi:peptide/nickel transport system ATP-binding protein
MNPLLEVRGLRKYFPAGGSLFRRGRAEVRAVEDVSFAIGPGESFALVGESGCGKSTVARCIAGLLDPDAGQIRLRGGDAAELRRRDRRSFCRTVQMVFQDPYGSLDPRVKVGATIAEPMLIDGKHSRREIRRRVALLLGEVGLPQEAVHRYPHEFSGGQRQRIAIARALALEPALIIADEPVSALDVSVQAQILMLLKSLQRSRNLAFLFVSHDLAVVRNFCDRMAVMYLGRGVEEGAVEGVLEHPLHPYTAALRDSTLPPDPAARHMLQRLEGEIPSALDPPPGCHFHPRCPRVMSACRVDVPSWSSHSPGRRVRCHLFSEATGTPSLKAQDPHDNLVLSESELPIRPAL